MMDFLYEELSESESAHVSQHLVGCARCRGEVAAFERTREAMRAVGEVEPPAAVSAILVHEAAKRAPSPARALREPRGEGLLARWFGRFNDLFRPLALHPAATALAALVLVAGVAGSLYLRGRVKGVASPQAASEAPSPARAEPAPVLDVESRPTGAKVAVDGHLAKTGEQAQPAEPAPTKPQQEEPEPDKLEPPPVRVDLAKPGYDRGRAAGLIDETQQKQLDDQGVTYYSVPPDEGEKAGRADKATSDGKLQEKPPEQKAPRGPSGVKDSLRKPAPALPRLPDTTANAVSGADPLVERDFAEDVGDDASGAGSEVATKKPRTEVNAPAGTPAPPAPSITPGAHRTEIAQPARPAPQVAAPPPPPPGDGQAGSAAATSTVDTPSQGYRPYRDNRAEENWAKARHGALSRYLAERRCRDAAKIANDLLDRNPEYYYQRVVGDKRLQTCKFDIGQEQARRQASRSKAAKPAAKPAVDSAAPKATTSE